MFWKTTILRRDRNELARGHGERPGRKPRQPDEQDRVLRPAAAADAGDQRDVGDQPVHRAEDGGPQPAARHIPVLRALVLGMILVGCGHEDILGKGAGRVPVRVAWA